MMRRAIEWFLGSVVIYLFVAACSAAGGVEGLVEMATGGLRNMMGGSFSMAGALGTGATPQSIVDPVPDANAEDGTRVVNLYRTTPDGLKTPEGYWDKELQIKCSFGVAEDGKDRCLPPNEGSVGSFFGNSACSMPVAVSSKGLCPKYGYSGVAPSSCGQDDVYRFAVYEVGDKTTTVYQKSGDNCVEVDANMLDQADFYSVTKITPTTFAEGTLVQGGS